MNNSFDDSVKDALLEEIKIPESVLAKADLAFKQIRDLEKIKPARFTSIGKQLIASIAVICVISLMLFGNSTLAAIRTFFEDKGIRKAVDNGYIQVLSENAVKSNGVAVTVDNIVSDKTKMAISFTLTFDHARQLKMVNDILLGLTIKDDKGRTIIENGVVSMIGGFSTKTDVSQKSKGILKYHLQMHSPAGEIVDVKSVLISVKSIGLLKEIKDGGIGRISGNWDFNLKLDDKFISKEEVKYKAENSSDIVELVSAEMLPTGMFIKFVMNRPIDENIMWKVTLVDEIGNVYKPSSIGGMCRTPDNRDLVYMTFEVTSFENKDKLKMLIKDADGEDAALKLVRDK